MAATCSIKLLDARPPVDIDKHTHTHARQVPNFITYVVYVGVKKKSQSKTQRRKRQSKKTKRTATTQATRKTVAVVNFIYKPVDVVAIVDCPFNEFLCMRRETKINEKLQPKVRESSLQ